MEVGPSERCNYAKGYEDRLSLEDSGDATCTVEEGVPQPLQKTTEEQTTAYEEVKELADETTTEIQVQITSVTAAEAVDLTTETPTDSGADYRQGGIPKSTIARYREVCSDHLLRTVDVSGCVNGHKFYCFWVASLGLGQYSIGVVLRVVLYRVPPPSE